MPTLLKENDRCTATSDGDFPRMATGGVGPRMVESDLVRLCSPLSGGNDSVSVVELEREREVGTSPGDLKGSDETESIGVCLCCKLGPMVIWEMTD